MTVPESTFWHCLADTVSFALVEFDVHGVRKRARAYSTLIMVERMHCIRNRHPTHLAYGRVNGMNGPNMGHSLPHVRPKTAKPATVLLIDIFGPLYDSQPQTKQFHSIIASLKLVSITINTIMLLFSRATVYFKINVLKEHLKINKHLKINVFKNK